MDEYSIGEVARRAGIRTSAIRFYESAGVLPAPARVNGRRRYDAQVLSALTIIQVAQKAGFTMAEIKTLFTGFAPGTPASARWQALAGRKLEEVTAQIEQLHGMQRLLETAMQCGCVDLEECAAICVGGNS
jgi:MerR family redox-sensitive transcriptional activator SoxR